MLRNKNKRIAGFTIIEVLIVLAIVGLIMLILFLAVPALQRNSRNTAMKNDVQNVLGGVGEFQGANNGSLPTSVSTSTTGDGVVTFSRSSGNNTTIKIQGTTSVESTQNAPTSATPEQGTIRVSLGFKCDGTRSPRALAAVFTVETSSSAVRQCQES